MLKRAGHTEAAVDLARMAGLCPAGVLCEVVTPDGLGMARLPELEAFAARHDLLLVTIADLIRHRRQRRARRVLMSDSVHEAEAVGLERRRSSSHEPPEGFARIEVMPRSTRIWAPTPYSRLSMGSPSSTLASTVSRPCAWSA